MPDEPSGVRPRVDTPEPVSLHVAPFGGARLQRVSLVAVVVVAFLAAAWVASELLSGLLLGVLTAFAVEPAHRRLVARFPKRRALMAAITITIVALTTIAVAAFVLYVLGDELMSSVGTISELAAYLTSPAGERALGRLGVPPQVASDGLASLGTRAGELASAGIGSLVGSTFHVFAGALIAFVTAYFALRDRQPIERRLALLLPLHPRTTRELVGEFRSIGRGTLVGSVIAAVLQGALAAVGFAICGVPRALLLGVLTAAASLVPVLGTLLVWVPVALVLIATGRVGAGVFQIVWGVVVTTSLVDYVLRPLIVGRECRSHPLLFLIGLIGGVEVFGGVGIIAGPMVMTLFASALRIYRREIVEPARRAAQAELDEPGLAAQGRSEAWRRT